MFEIELLKNGEIGIITRKSTIKVNVAQSGISADLAVGEIQGPGEFEIGEATITGVQVEGAKGGAGARGGAESGLAVGVENEQERVGGLATIYTIEIGGIRIGVSGAVESGLDDLGPIDILATSSVKVVGIVEPKIVVPTDNFEKFAELKVETKYEKRLKIKNEASLPAAMEIYRLG
jgi:hypothetical protein